MQSLSIPTRKLSSIKARQMDKFLSSLPPEVDVEWKFESRCHILEQLIHHVRGFDTESFSMVCKIVGELEKVHFSSYNNFGFAYLKLALTLSQNFRHSRGQKCGLFSNGIFLH